MNSQICCGSNTCNPIYMQIDILSCMRHPNMVLLLGACPEYGILIYEYMANGSLEDCLFKKKKKEQACFVLAAEVPNCCRDRDGITIPASDQA